MKTTKPPTVEQEVMLAYSDCHGTEAQMKAGYETRNLNFKASAALPRDKAVKLMAKAVKNGYNEFDADKLKLLPNGSMVLIARQGSVCVYVTPTIPDPIGKMMADEWSIEEFQNEGSKIYTRIWWD